MDYEGQPVIILGMGRSGTSILASLLQTSNVSMYRNSLPPGEINPRGFAEEALAVALHQKLKRLNYSRFEADPDYDNPLIDEIRPFELTDELGSEAAGLVAALQRPGFWGWKDPRTVLFIDLWLALLPTVRMLIPLRHPIEVFNSYLQRLPNERLMRRPDQVFRSYTAYHSKILQVVERHREQCYVFYAQTAYQNLACLQTALEAFLGHRLRFQETANAFYSQEFTDLGLGAAEHESFAKFFPTPASFFDGLNSRADMPFARDLEQAKPRLELSALNNLAEFVKSPDDEPDCTPFLVRMIAPTSERYSGYLARQADELIQKVSWLEQQAQTTVNEQALCIRDLESSKTYLLGQIEQHANAVDQQNGYIRELESAKQYMIDQLERHAQALDQQKHYIRELESAKRCFVDQLEQQKQHMLDLESTNARYQNEVRNQEKSIRELHTRKEAFRTLFGLR